MASILEKLADIGELVSTAYQKHFGEEDPDAPGVGDDEGLSPSGLAPVTDPETAYRVLELPENATLDEVRAAYRRMAQHYHPQTRLAEDAQADAARQLMRSLLEALEVLEEHLLPLPAAPKR